MDKELSAEEITATENDAFNRVFDGDQKKETAPEPEKDKAEAETQAEQAESSEPDEQTEETPPVMNGEQLKELMAQVGRIPELEKRLRDEGGRYGALKQSLEQLQQKIAESSTRQDIAGNTEDTKELLAELRDEFPELANPLEKAFARVIAAKGGISQDSINKIVSERIAEQRDTERAATLEEAVKNISELHPDFWEIKETPEFATWKESLNPRLRARLETSEDALFVAEQVDAFKEWRKKDSNDNPHQKNKRLEGAVLPTQGNNKPTRSLGKTEEEAFNAVFNKRKRK